MWDEASNALALRSGQLNAQIRQHEESAAQLRAERADVESRLDAIIKATKFVRSIKRAPPPEPPKEPPK